MSASGLRRTVGRVNLLAVAQIPRQSPKRADPLGRSHQHTFLLRLVEGLPWLRIRRGRDTNAKENLNEEERERDRPLSLFAFSECACKVHAIGHRPRPRSHLRYSYTQQQCTSMRSRRRSRLDHAMISFDCGSAARDRAIARFLEPTGQRSPCIIYGAHQLWAHQLWGPSTMGPINYGAHHLWGPSSMGPIIYEAHQL